MNFDKIRKKLEGFPIDPVYLLMIFSFIFRMINFMFDARWVVFAPAALLYKLLG